MHSGILNIYNGNLLRSRMRTNGSTRISLLLIVLMCASVFTPIAPTAEGEESNITNKISYGVEYIWTNLDDDFEVMTNIDLKQILMDIMDSADEAGMNLFIGEAITDGIHKMNFLRVHLQTQISCSVCLSLEFHIALTKNHKM